MSNTSNDQAVVYNPNKLFDHLIEKFSLKNDAALARHLGLAPPVVSKIRHHHLPVSAAVLIRIHEVTDISIRDLRYLMGDRRDKFRISDADGRTRSNKLEDVASFSQTRNPPTNLQSQAAAV